MQLCYVGPAALGLLGPGPEDASIARVWLVCWRGNTAATQYCFPRSSLEVALCVSPSLDWSRRPHHRGLQRSDVKRKKSTAPWGDRCCGRLVSGQASRLRGGRPAKGPSADAGPAGRLRGLRHVRRLGSRLGTCGRSARLFSVGQGFADGPAEVWSRARCGPWAGAAIARTQISQSGDKVPREAESREQRAER